MRFEDLWNDRVATGAARARSLEGDLKRIDKQVEQFLDCIVAADTPSIRKAYESRIDKLEAQKLEISEKIGTCGTPLRSFDRSVRTAFDFLENPYKLWISERLEQKRAVLKLTFADKLA